MLVSFELQDELYRKFKAAVVLNDESEEHIIESLIENYAKKSFLKEAGMEAEDGINSRKVQMPITAYSEPNKAVSRIPLWARRPDQVNHRILQSFFVCEEDKLSNKNAMRQYFVKFGYGTEWQFDNNFASMCTNEGHSHGKVFECDSVLVRLSSDVESIARSHLPDFLSGKPEASSNIASELISENAAETQKKKFVLWFRSLSYNGRPYNPVTISGYSGRLESACNDKAFSAISVKNLFTVTDVNEFRRIKREIQKSPGYDNFDQKSHKGFTAALNKYEEFLGTLS